MRPWRCCFSYLAPHIQSIGTETIWNAEALYGRPRSHQTELQDLFPPLRQTHAIQSVPLRSQVPKTRRCTSCRMPPSAVSLCWRIHVYERKGCPGESHDSELGVRVWVDVCAPRVYPRYIVMHPVSSTEKRARV